MGQNYRTAMGKSIDMDMLRLSNEDVIAVGNMKVNARGDELGPGGKVVKTRAQAMRDFHKINTPVAVENDDLLLNPPSIPKPAGKMKTPIAVETPPSAPASAPSSSTYTKPRGSFAESVASETEVNTELLDPAPLLGTNKNDGVQRI